MANAVHHRARPGAVGKHRPVHGVNDLLCLGTLSHSVSGGLPSGEFAFMLSLKASSYALRFCLQGSKKDIAAVAATADALALVRFAGVIAADRLIGEAMQEPVNDERDAYH